MDHYFTDYYVRILFIFCFYLVPDIRYNFIIYAKNTLSQILSLQRSTLWELGIKSFKDSHLFIHLYEFIYNCILTYIMQIMDNAFDSHLLTTELSIKLPLSIFLFVLFCTFLLNQCWMEPFMKMEIKQKQRNYNCIRK